MTTTPDRPTVDLVLGSLKKEVETKRPEDFIVVLSGNKRITFKYPLTFKRNERKAFQADIAAALSDGDEVPLLKRMLSDADLKKYDDENVDDDVHQALIKRVGEHFGLREEIDEEGKDSASDS